MLRDGRVFGRKAGSFTLQWHLTNACDGNCRHCYDRSKLETLSRAQALGILDDLIAFCAQRKVACHVSLTGGNPVLYPHFFALYQRIAASGANISILGNPISEREVVELARLRKPRFYQVSLEGLQEHNDAIRGQGNYERVMRFLPLLRRHRIRAHVMLTLTRSNMNQVVALGEALRGVANRFTFNRLAQVGQGTDLEIPSREEYMAFLETFIAASRTNALLGFKDSLFNIVRHQLDLPLLGGCTGFGCGAAFNFLALLPNGEAHACRKFPSPVGNVLQLGLARVYDGTAAKRYRRGSTACAGCRIRNVCGGCLAVGFGSGIDVLRERDPHCFWEERSRALSDLRPRGRSRGGRDCRL